MESFAFSMIMIDLEGNLHFEGLITYCGKIDSGGWGRVCEAHAIRFIASVSDNLLSKSTYRVEQQISIIML